MEWQELASGYGLLEGPTIDHDGSLLFSDVPNGGVHRLRADGVVETVVPKRRGVGGIAHHIDGGLVVTGRSVEHVRNGRSRAILDRESPATAFNDMACDAAGRIYVGTLIGYGSDAHEPGHLLRIELDGSVTTLYGDVGLTNGIGFSPDGATLYHADTAGHHVLVHRLEDDQVGDRRLLVLDDAFRPDGLAVAVDGSIWVADAGRGRVIRFGPDDALIDVIDVPAPAVTSVCFGGRDLYAVTYDGSVLRANADIEGSAVHPARV